VYGQLRAFVAQKLAYRVRVDLSSLYGAEEVDYVRVGISEHRTLGS
jgi:hypothetical protein